MSETDRRLKDYLNTNQSDRERMCLEVLAVQVGYTEVRPRLPKGGPDGGRDIQALYKGQLSFGAVGFANDAGDTPYHRKQVEQKFERDLASALEAAKDASSSLIAFVFFTNVSLTPGITDKLALLAKKNGVHSCEVFDRERLRIVLDSNRGYAIRFRYLGIALSDAEQKDFFAAWADGISALVGSGINGIDRTTKRIQFLLEAQLPLDRLALVVRLDESIWNSCKGEFCFQCNLLLQIQSDGLVGLTFGGGTEEIVQSLEEWEAKGRESPKNGQYGFCFTTMLPDRTKHTMVSDKAGNGSRPKNYAEAEHLNLIRTFTSASVLRVEKDHLVFNAVSEPWIDRYNPTCKLLELNAAMIIFDCNRELASHIKEMVLIGNGYELLKIAREEIKLESGEFDRFKLPQNSKQDSKSHEWVTLRPPVFSGFHIDLMGRTPKRYDWD